MARVKEYDFVITWDKNKGLFTNTLMADCRRKGLSFLLVTEKNVRPLTKGLVEGDLRIKFLLDTEATYDVPGEPYARMNYAIKDTGGVVINDPDRTKMAVDKSVMQYELMDSNIPIPYTVVVRNWEPKTFRLTDEERSMLGSPFIIKPACGWGHQGVVHEAKGTVREIAQARNYDPHDNFLLQEKVKPIRLNDKKAWFRVFHVFDKIIPCWWDDSTGRYEHMTLMEFRRYRLAPLVRYTTKIADRTKMVWFSTEIAVDKKHGEPRFLAIDYVNDQCDMEAKSENKDSGVPDHIVRFTAFSMVHAAGNIIKGKKAASPGRYTILLRGNNRIGTRGLGYAPEPLVT